MKQLIKDVLHDMSAGQIELSSTGACELIATTITATLKTKGSYKEYTEYELEEQQARASWVCSICGKNTFDLDYDYIGSNTNHLSCELRLEQDENYRKKNWLQEKHEDKVFGNDDVLEDWEAEVKKTDTLIDKSLEDYERNKLSEEIVDDTDKGYIYESSDGGKTIYKREFGSDERIKIKVKETEK